MSSPADTEAATAASRAPRPDGSPGASERFRFRCPECHGTAFVIDADLFCPGEGRRFAGESGVLPLLRWERRRALAPFLEAYRRVRRIEGWGGAASYYLGLPFDSDGRHRDIWKIRARSYRAALDVLGSRFADMKRVDEWNKRSLRVLELGAGNGWFSWRMAEAGHHVLATDISLDDEDGLGAIERYARPCPAFRERLVRALLDMEELALDDSQLDVVVANASLHYAGSLPAAISEVHRVLRPGGLFLVLDSPVFDDARSGSEMVRERNRRHEAQLDAPLPHETTGYLLLSGFSAALESAGFRVRVERPFEGIPRLTRRAYRALRKLTSPARFPLFAAEKIDRQP
jgi:SAM-dependent methyltransferase